MEDDNIERHEGSLMGCDPIVDLVGWRDVINLLWTEPIPEDWHDVTDEVMDSGSSHPSNFMSCMFRD